MTPKVKPWLVLAVIFIAGILTGVSLTIVVGPRFKQAPEQRDMRKHWLMYLTHELDLTPDQQAKIQPILTDANSELQSVHHDEMRRGAQIFKGVHEQIAALLTPEQQVKLQKMESERQKMFSGYMRAWGAPHDGPGGMFKHNEPDAIVPPPPPPGQPAPPPPGPPSSPTPTSLPPLEPAPRPTTD